MGVANYTTSFKWYSGKKQQLLEINDKIMYDVARQTLDRTYQTIPLAKSVNSGRLRTSSISGGVKGSNGNYYIGSYTSYAKYVWVMGDNTNWSTAGTNGEWYARVWRKQGKIIVQNAIERNKLK